MSFFKQIQIDKRGISLIETLMAVSIFTFVVVIATNILMDVVHSNKRSEISKEIFDEVGIIMKQITNEIQNGTIDYEEYFNYYVVNNKNSDTILGVNTGVYESRFYDPGAKLIAGTPPTTDSGNNPNNLGLVCSYPTTYNPTSTPCEIIYTLSADYNKGSNTSSKTKDCGSGVESSDATAFCDPHIELTIPHGENPTNNTVENLFLINNEGDEKTMIVKKKLTDTDYAVGVMKMTGSDLDQNGLIDTFTCKEGFFCDTVSDNIINNAIKNGYDNNTNTGDGIDHNIKLVKLSEKDTKFNYLTSEFIPISPRRLNITNLSFIINPLDNPYVAFGEENLQHPTVTIILEAELSSEFKDEYPGDFIPIKVQTTVSAGVVGHTPAYPPINELKQIGVPSWINSVF